MIESLSAASSVDNLDLAYWRDFLKLLKDMGVQGFSRGDTAITFYRDWDPELVSVDGKPVKDTEDGKVPGFIPTRMPRPAKPESAFQNPSLWPATGKPYSFGD